MKEKFIKYFIKIAEETAKLSYANKLKVGAILVKDNRPIVTGYNGTLSGFSNECEDENNKTKLEVLHAEQNVISFCAKHGLKAEDSILFITHAPCVQCAKLIAQAGIKEVYFKNLYKNNDGINLLKNFNVIIEQIQL